jgi:hypothetical protein
MSNEANSLTGGVVPSSAKFESLPVTAMTPYAFIDKWQMEPCGKQPGHLALRLVRVSSAWYEVTKKPRDGGAEKKGEEKKNTEINVGEGGSGS